MQVCFCGCVGNSGFSEGFAIRRSLELCFLGCVEGGSGRGRT